jgi:uroporphyrinogen-III decarboxylase
MVNIMTGYEIIKRAIEFKSPPRIGIRFDEVGVNDTYTVTVGYGKDYNPSHPDADEWGCVKERTDLPNIGQVKQHPIKTMDDLNRHRFPEADDESIYEAVDMVLPFAQDRYVLGYIGNGPFERLHFLHGFTDTLADCYINPPIVETLLDIIVNFQLGLIRNYRERYPGKIHGITTSDDWGTQTAIFMSVDMWRQFFKPLYKKLIDATHDAGMHFWLHSCGKVNELMPEFVDLGLDVINLQQPRALGIEEIGRDFRGKICFEAPLDIQRTLPNGSPQEMEEEAKLLLEHWGTPEGGFILGDYDEPEAIQVSFEQKQAMFDAFKKAGKFDAEPS